MKKIIIAVTLACMVSALQIFSQDTTDNSAPSDLPANQTAKIKSSYPTAFYLVKCQDCTDQESRHIEKCFSNAIDEIPTASLFSADAMKDQSLQEPAPACGTTACALEAGKKSGAQKIIIATVKKRIVEKEIPLGAEGKNKYLVEVQRTIFFDLTEELHDAEKETTDTSTTATSAKDEVDDTIETMVQKLIPYFEITRPDTTEPQKVEELVQPETKEPLRFTPFASLCVSMMAPAGKFRDLAGSGYGFTMDGGVRDLFIEKSVIRAALAYHYMIPEHEDLQSLSMLRIGVQGGYQFHVYDKFFLTPLLGFNYIFHFTKGTGAGETASSSKIYTDPSIDIQAELSYRFNDAIEFTFSPGYLVFFETDNTGMAFTINAGGRYYFH